MHTAYLVITVVFALMVSYSGVGKIRRDPIQVKVVHETVGVPLKYFPMLAACEFAGALGLVVGIWWPIIGVAAGIGLVLYFVGAIVSHLRVGDVKGIGSAAFMLLLAAGALALRVITLSPYVFAFSSSLRYNVLVPTSRTCLSFRLLIAKASNMLSR
jgi:hypothetical protein